MNKVELLTPREIQVIKLICKEHTNQEIAEKLDLSRRTVETHRDRIIKRLKLKTSVGLLKFAIKNNIYKL